VRALSIRRLIDAGHRDEAMPSAEQLRTLLQDCLDLGLTEDELSAACARIRRLCEEGTKRCRAPSSSARSCRTASTWG